MGVPTRVTIGVAVIGVVLGGAGLLQARVELAGVQRLAVERELFAVARGVGHVSALPVGDDGRLQQRLEELRVANGLHRVSLFERTQAGGLRVATAGPALTPSLIDDGELRSLDDGTADYEQERREDGHFAELVYPLRPGPSAERYALGLHYDLRAFDAELARRQSASALITVALVACAAAAVPMLLNRLVFAPVGQLRTAIGQIRSGELHTRLDWVRQDELGELARDFDDMAGDLERSHTQLRALALEDPVTGLPNRRAVTDRLEAELRRSRLEGYPVSVVVVDVDRFKHINDTWGHATGDDALRGLANVMQLSLRPADICGRLGGDEFVFALADADTGLARQITARLRRSASQLHVTDGLDGVSISAGIAGFGRHESQTELLDKADQALYRAKSTGRGKTCVYAPVPRALSARRDRHGAQ